MSTDNGGKLTDTIIIATYNPKEQKASFIKKKVEDVCLLPFCY